MTDTRTDLVAGATEEEVAWFSEAFTRMAHAVCQVIRGKDEQVNLTLLALTSEGHLLLEDAPGVGKTTLARALAGVAGGDWRRIQFTPDLLPTDVTGVSIWNQRAEAFEFRPGPVFANVVVGDEINRASPKTQSALLEVMEERQVTVDGISHRVPRPFVVVATQNPVDMDGTYNLPEAQLDRFLLKLSIGYPDAVAEAAIVANHHGKRSTEVTAVTTTEHVTAMIDIASRVHVDPELVNYVVRLVQATRQSSEVRLGASPRATLGLIRTAQSLAAAEGRAYAVGDDVKRLAVPVLAHRLILSAEARLRGLTADQIVEHLLTTTAVPGGLAR